MPEEMLAEIEANRRGGEPPLSGSRKNFVPLDVSHHLDGRHKGGQNSRRPSGSIPAEHASGRKLEQVHIFSCSQPALKRTIESSTLCILLLYNIWHTAGQYHLHHCIGPCIFACMRICLTAADEVFQTCPSPNRAGRRPLTPPLLVCIQPTLHRDD